MAAVVGVGQGELPAEVGLDLLLGRPATKDFLAGQKTTAKRQAQPVLPL